MTSTADRRPGAGAAIQSDRAGRGQHSRGLVASGAFYPPAGRRTLGVVIVRACPSATFRQMHLHRAETAGSAHMAERTGSCGATYLLNVHHALPGGVA